MKFRYVIGIDEVGRGPIAGPVTVCALMAEGSTLDNLRGNFDSKKFSPKCRIEIAQILRKLKQEGMLDYRIVSASASLIDKRGIMHCVRKAINQALYLLTLGALGTKCEVLLDGGLRASKKYPNQKIIIKGDTKVPIIGLASVVAKVHRDRFMTHLGVRHPNWGFEKHKGYGTKEHYAALKKFGPSPIHRQSFLKKL